MPPMSNIPLPMLRFDEKYYWELVTFLVEGHLFRVPKHNFVEHSKAFTLQYLVGRDLGTNSKAGSCDDDPLSHAIELDVSADDFHCFLKALYPRYSKGLLKDEWLRVLELSHRWSFGTYREMAIEALTPFMDPTDKLVLGKEYAITTWVSLGLAEFVTRAEGISQDEAERIGWRNAIDLFNIREAHFASMTSLKGSQQPFDVEVAISVAFRSDLVAVHDQESAYLDGGETSPAGDAMLKATALEEQLKQQEWILSQGKHALQALRDECSAAAATSMASNRATSHSLVSPTGKFTPTQTGAVLPAVKLEEDAVLLRVPQQPVAESSVPRTQHNPSPAQLSAGIPTLTGTTGLSFPPNVSPFTLKSSALNPTSVTPSAHPSVPSPSLVGAPDWRPEAVATNLAT